MSILFVTNDKNQVVGQPLNEPSQSILYYYYITFRFRFKIPRLFFSNHMIRTSTFRTAVSYVVFNLLLGVIAVCTVYVWIGMQRYGKQDHFEFPEIFFFSVVYEAAAHNMGDLHQLWAALTFFAVTVAGLASVVSRLSNFSKLYIIMIWACVLSRNSTDFLRSHQVSITKPEN